MTVSECSYHGNIATGQGGALYLQEVSPITITRTDFEHNQAVVGGGALYLTEHSLADITDAAFKSNTAASGGEDAAHGGALLLTGKSRVVLAHSNASESVATCGGFAYVEGGSNATIENSRFSANTAMRGCETALAPAVVFPDGFTNKQGGGAFFLTDDLHEGTAVDCNACEFDANVASGDSNGGAFAMTASKVRLTKTVFESNRAEANGGAVAAKRHSVMTLVDGSNTFESNQAMNGGAIYLSANASYETDSTVDSSRRRLATIEAEDVRFARELEEEYSFNYTYDVHARRAHDVLHHFPEHLARGVQAVRVRYGIRRRGGGLRRER